MTKAMLSEEFRIKSVAAHGPFVPPCFPKGFRHAPLQNTGVRLARSGLRSAPLDLMRNWFFQICLFSTTLEGFWLIVAGAGPLLRGAPGQHSKSYEFYKGFGDSGRVLRCASRGLAI